MKKLTSLVVVTALGLILGLNAVTVTVGTLNPNLFTYGSPIFTSLDYSYTQQIYTQPEINHQGPITKISFYQMFSQFAPGNSLENSHEWDIYMGHVSRGSFSDLADWEPVANLELVFSGSVLDYFVPIGQWMEITLDTPFDYNNTDNLLLAVHENTPGSDPNLTWATYSIGGPTKILFWFDMFGEGNVDPNNPPEAIESAAERNTIQLEFLDTAAPPAAPVVQVTVSGSNVELEWDAVPNANSYKVYASEDPYNFGSDPVTIVNTNSVTLPATSAMRFFKVTSDTGRGAGNYKVMLGELPAKNPQYHKQTRPYSLH